MNCDECVEFGKLFRAPQYLGVSFSWITPEATDR